LSSFWLVLKQQWTIEEISSPFFLFLAAIYWLEVGITGHNFGRGPSKDHSTKVWSKLTQWFLRRRLKCEKLTTDDDDGLTTDETWWQKLTWPLARWAKNEWINSNTDVFRVCKLIQDHAQIIFIKTLNGIMIHIFSCLYLHLKCTFANILLISFIFNIKFMFCICFLLSLLILYLLILDFIHFCHRHLFHSKNICPLLFLTSR
jgi:hypothetical protein